MQTEDEFLLSEFKKIMHRNVREDVVDLDNNYSQKFEFTIQRFEDILRDTNRIIPPNRWSYHRVGFTTKGSGEFITGIYNFKSPKNTLIIVPSRVITSSSKWTPDTEGYFVLFNMDFFLQNNFSYKNIENKKILSGSFQPYIHINDKQAAEISAIFEAIIKERHSGISSINELLAVKVTELLVVCERLFDEQLHFEANQPVMDIIKRFSELVENNFTEQRTVKFYAEQLNMHPNYLNSLIKKHTGETAKESIQNRLMLEAKYLLHTTDLSIKEISHRAGFDDPNYFTSFFTRHEEMSPGNYRSLFV